MAVTLKHQTKAQLRNRLRIAYRNAEGERLARIAHKILKLIEDGYYTDAQIKTEFGKDDAQYVTFKARLTKLRESWLDIRDAKGD